MIMFATASLNTKLQDMKSTLLNDTYATGGTVIHSLCLSPADVKPVGEVFKLEIPAIEERSDPMFGTHIREAIDIMQDWVANR